MKTFTSRSVFSSAVLLAASMGTQGIVAHSWIDSVRVVESAGGNLVNSTEGFIRNYAGRVGDADTRYTYRINPGDESKPVCTSEQQQPGQAENFPMLSANPGDTIEVEYTENGHVSDIIIGNDGNNSSGKIMFYASQKQDPNRTFESVLEWTEDGTGGDGEGRLIGTTDFDDGVCKEDRGGASPPELADRVAGPCKARFTIPEDLPSNDVQEIIWVWDFSEHRPAPHVEFYTSCFDIELASKKGKNSLKVRSAKFRI